MVVPHPEIALKAFLIGVEQIVIGRNTPSCVNMLQRFELRELRLRKLLGLPDQIHHFVCPLCEQSLPVLVVIEGPLLELLCTPRNLGWIGDAVATDIDTPVDD